jgi:DNA repair exonuclease SbcCD ATPase subunit
MQLEARQLADAQRRLGSEASRTAPGNAGDDARRRLAADQERLADRTQRLGESVKQMAGSGSEAGDQQAMAEAGRELDKQNVAGRMRESAQALRQGQNGEQKPAADPNELARALDKVADQLGSATGGRDAETAKLSDQLGQAQDLRDRLGKLQRSMDDLAKSEPGNAEQQQQRQRDLQGQMQEAQKLAEQVGRSNPGIEKGGTTPEQWERSFSAPGTEGFKQDFAKWESLKKNLLVALERTESQLSEQLRARESRERLNAGRHDAVSDTYRDLVDRYYQSLAIPRKPSR